MKVKNKYRKKRFTLHDIAIELIRSRVGGVDAHGMHISVGNLIPDVITEDTIHEVIAVDIRPKLKKYLANPSIYQRTLWLALPVHTSEVFDRIRIVEVNHRGFANLSVKEVELEPIVLPSPPFLIGTKKIKETKRDVLKDIERELQKLGFKKEADSFKFVREKLWAHLQL